VEVVMELRRGKLALRRVKLVLRVVRWRVWVVLMKRRLLRILGGKKAHSSSLAKEVKARVPGVMRMILGGVRGEGMVVGMGVTGGILTFRVGGWVGKRVVLGDDSVGVAGASLGVTSMVTLKL